MEGRRKGRREGRERRGRGRPRTQSLTGSRIAFTQGLSPPWPILTTTSTLKAPVKNCQEGNYEPRKPNVHSVTPWKSMT